MPSGAVLLLIAAAIAFVVWLWFELTHREQDHEEQSKQEH